MTDNHIQTRFENVIISPDATIREAIARLDNAGTGALVLCSNNRKLVGLLTDGDVRRAILKSQNLDERCLAASNLNPVMAVKPVPPAEALRIMNWHDVSHLPVVDANGILCDFILRRDLGVEAELEETAQSRLRNVVISPNTSIADAISALEKAGTGALVLCSEARKLFGMLTDGDIRRAILNGRAMSAPCETIASLHPVVAHHPIVMSDALRLMNEHDINHVPVVDGDGVVVEFLLRKDLVVDGSPDLSAVIMAGGYGKRLLPLTETVPKPMLPVGDRPLLELTIQQLRNCGIRDVNLTTHYLPESIVNHFGNGESFGVRLNYLNEDHPMGTAGGLKQMKRPEGPVLVINGDIVTRVPFQEMLAYHRKHGAMLTVGVRKYDIQVPFGVVECQDVRIKRLQEKPSLSFFINAGVYLLEPSVYDHIPGGRAFDMTDLIQKLLEAERPVVSFPIIEYWLDIGKQEDYRKAQEDVRKGML